MKQASLVVLASSLKLCMVKNMMTYHICHKLASNMIASHKHEIMLVNWNNLCNVGLIEKTRPFDTKYIFELLVSAVLKNWVVIFWKKINYIWVREIPNPAVVAWR